MKAFLVAVLLGSWVVVGCGRVPKVTCTMVKEGKKVSVKCVPE